MGLSGTGAETTTVRSTGALLGCGMPGVASRVEPVALAGMGLAVSNQKIASVRSNKRWDTQVGISQRRVGSIADSKTYTMELPGSDPPAGGSMASAVAADQTSVLTNKLGALVHVSETLRDDVRAHFGRWHLWWAPSYSMDVVAILRHAARADRLDAARDWLLLIVWAAFTVIAGRLLLDGWWPGYLIALLGVALLFALFEVLARRKKVSWRSVLRWTFGNIVPAASVFLFTVVVTMVPRARWALIAIAVALLTLWLLGVAFSVAGYVRASRLRRTERPLRQLAPALSEKVESRAESTASSNLLVYAHTRAKGPLGPFVGAGHRLHRWSTPPVDVTVGRKRNGDQRGKPEKVDVEELHKHLQQETLNRGLPQLRCEHRLYADGSSLARTPELLVQPRFGPPRNTVPEELVLSRVAAPLNYQRGYLCLEVTDRQWHGDVVVTMFVRAVREEDLLHLEVSLHALPPNELPTVPSRPVSAVWSGVKDGTREVTRTALGAMGRRCRAAVSPVSERAAEWRHRHQIRRGVGFDFGAETSLREHLSLGQVIHYNAMDDTMGHVHRLQYRLVHAFSQYLTSRGIETYELAKESITIINNNQQNVFNDLKAGAITFGTNSPASGTVAQPAPSTPSPDTAEAP